MRASIVIRSKDEAARLRLTLASLARQTEMAEVVVVNDGSTDSTRDVIGEAETIMPVVGIHHDRPTGRSHASNIGAAQASGEIVIFLDGDTMAAPDLVERHLTVHRSRSNVIGRGETFHLRGTRIFADPETGSAMPGEEARVAALPNAERERLLITRDGIAEDFAGIDRRAQAGIYPGTGPRLLYEMEMDALRSHPECDGLWIAASGSNQSVRRAAFQEVGGFDAELSINEHRELALRLVRTGARMAPVDGARTYHMTHRKGWRDPLVDRDWETRFYDKHPIPEVPLMSVLWAGLSDSAGLPAGARIQSIPSLVESARRCDGVVGIDAVRMAHMRASSAGFV
jgi:glycosyltransferase involved in cell wall biosynthesis